MFEIDVTNSGENPGTLTIPLAPYKYLYAYGDNEQLPVSVSETGKMNVEIPAGFSGYVTTAFREPWFWRLSEVISLIMIICLCTVERKPWQIR